MKDRLHLIIIDVIMYFFVAMVGAFTTLMLFGESGFCGMMFSLGGAAAMYAIRRKERRLFREGHPIG